MGKNVAWSLSPREELASWGVGVTLEAQGGGERHSQPPPSLSPLPSEPPQGCTYLLHPLDTSHPCSDHRVGPLPGIRASHPASDFGLGDFLTFVLFFILYREIFFSESF